MNRSSPATILITAAIVGVGLVFARGGFAQFSGWEVPLIIGAGLAAAAALVGVGYLIGRGWDRAWSLLKRGRNVSQRDRSS